MNSLTSDENLLIQNPSLVVDKLLGGNVLRFLGLKRSQFDEDLADKADTVESE